LYIIGDKIQTTLKTLDHLKPNHNKIFPIETIQAVQHIFNEFHFPLFLDHLKHSGHQLTGLVVDLVSYKMTENLSISRCHHWTTINPLFLEHIHLSIFGDDALYCCLEKIGENRQIILLYIMRILKEHHDIGLDMLLMDWTSSYFEAKPTDLIKYWYNRDHRPDRPQVTIGLTQDHHSQIPVGLSIQPRNINDQQHFKITYE
jgi:transposase